MRTFKISAIKSKAKRLGQDYLDDCLVLAETWNEKRNTATFTDAAVNEIQATWKPQGQPINTTHCKGCRGL